jgi:hypothetical protein
MCVLEDEHDVAVQPEEEGIMAVEPLVAALNISTYQTGDAAVGGECSL